MSRYDVFVCDRPCGEGRKYSAVGGPCMFCKAALAIVNSVVCCLLVVL